MTMIKNTQNSDSKKNSIQAAEGQLEFS